MVWRFTHTWAASCAWDHSRSARKTRIRVLNRGIGAPDRSVRKFGANLGPKLGPFRPPICGSREAKATDSTGLLVGAVGIEFTVLPLIYDFPFLLFSSLNLAQRALVALGNLHS